MLRTVALRLGTAVPSLIGVVIVTFPVYVTFVASTQTAAEVLGLLRSVVDEHRQTVVMVTHDPVAASYADRVLVLADGRIVTDLPQPGADRIAEHLAALGRRSVGPRS